MADRAQAYSRLSRWFRADGCIIVTSYFCMSPIASGPLVVTWNVIHAVNLVLDQILGRPSRLKANLWLQISTLVRQQELLTLQAG